MSMSRRTLLKLGGLPAVAGLGAAPVHAPIRRVEAFPVAYPLAGHFKFFAKPERPAVLVKLTCEDGSYGWGESVPVPTWSYETPESVLSALRDYLAPAIIGRDPFDLAGAHTAMNKAIAPSFSTGMPIAKAGIDLALHDLIGRVQKKSTPALWGRAPLERLTLSWTVNPADLAETEKLVVEGRSRGYRHFNVKLGPDPRFDIEMCKLVRRLAPDAFFWGDANGGYDLADALWVAPKLADIGMDVLEQPVAAARLTGYREMRRQRALPILMDEGLVSPVELMEFIKLDLLDGVAMKPARTGGLVAARKQIEMAREAGLLVLGSGLTDPDVSLAASLQLYGAYQIKFPCALNGPQFLARTSFLKQPLLAVNGEIAVPAGPGLGVDVDEEKVRKSVV